MIIQPKQIRQRAVDILIGKLKQLFIFISVFAFISNVLASPDTDGDGISDALDSLPNQKSGVVISLNETNSILEYSGDIPQIILTKLSLSQREREDTGPLNYFLMENMIM